MLLRYRPAASTGALTQGNESGQASAQC